MNYYISDLHIKCQNSFDGRTLEHDELLVNNWNSVINNNDTVYVLGDIGRVGRSRDNEYVSSIVARLKGKKILITGNHDAQGLRDNRISQQFVAIHNYLEIVDNYNGLNQKIVLSHYPIFSWNGCYKDTILLYGHTHGNFDDQIFQDSLKQLRQKVKQLNEENIDVKKFRKEPYAYNVGCMIPYMDYTPRTLAEIMSEVSV
ncbi:metallophosphoesterase [Eubacterium ramulus]|uniref:metallophosphoesterase n=1 Tax=Eubacterium ramulus TaxID=39490 RepID=UPI00399A6A1B